MTQSLNANTANPVFTPPILATEHPVHRGAVQSLIGGQNQLSSRSLGDYLQTRMGPQGEAHIAYADSNNIIGSAAGQVPAGAKILSAKLNIHTGSTTNDNTGGTVELHRMLTSWDDNSTWGGNFSGTPCRANHCSAGMGGKRCSARQSRDWHGVSLA